MSGLRALPSPGEQRALMRYALRLLVAYVGGAMFVIGLLHLIGVGAWWSALTLSAAGAAVAAAGIAGAHAALRKIDRRRTREWYLRDRRETARRSAGAAHNLGRRVG